MTKATSEVSKPEPGKVYWSHVDGLPPEGRRLLYWSGRAWKTANSEHIVRMAVNARVAWRKLPPAPVPPSSLSEAEVEEYVCCPGDYQSRCGCGGLTKGRLDECERAAEAEPPAPQPFPLSREDFEEPRHSAIRRKLREHYGVYEWWCAEYFYYPGPFDYDTVVAAWHAAGCPGADAPATQAEGTEEGPWRDQRSGLARHRITHAERRVGCEVTVEFAAGDELTLAMLLKDANDKAKAEAERDRARLLLETAEAQARGFSAQLTDSEAEAERLRGELEDSASSFRHLRRSIDAVEAALGIEEGEMYDPGERVRDLVAKAERAEEDAFREAQKCAHYQCLLDEIRETAIRPVSSQRSSEGGA